MFSNFASTQENEDSDFIGQQSWETFLQSESQSLFSLAPFAPGPSKTLFERFDETNQKMEEDYTLYDQQLCLSKSTNETGLFMTKREESYQLDSEYYNYRNEIQDCACRSEQGSEEEALSVTTKDSAFSGESPIESEKACLSDNDKMFDDENEYDLQLKRMIQDALIERSEEEKAYVQAILHWIVASVKEILSSGQFNLNNQMIEVIVSQLIDERRAMIKEEKSLLNNLIRQEISEVRRVRPEKMISEDELVMTHRKEKKTSKGNRNSSALNHLNENYVSNIFQFAKKGFPEDKEIQRIGNERNVSASSFKRLVEDKMTDGVMTRKAKARIIESGGELVGNIEYWMREGYFDQCNDREKYIVYKEKVLKDLALTRNF